MHYLYKITNTVNGKIYIGMTSNPDRRKYQHFNRKGLKYKSLISLAVNKYGKDNFSFEVLCIGSKDYIVDLEFKAIQSYNSLTPNGYNLRVGGENCGSGHKIEHISTDVPLYVTGFWFPNRRTCLEKLTINEKSIYKWKSEGTLGDVQHLREDSIKDVPCYISGFWFPTMLHASEALQNNIENIKMQINRGRVEALPYKSIAKLGDKNPMFGKTGSAHHNSKQVKINGVVYGSIAEAARQTEFTKSMIEKRLKNKTTGFEYVQGEE